MRKALITGISGQDGSYLAEFLLSKGYEVHGIVRRSSSISRSRLDHLRVQSRFTLHYGNLSDAARLAEIIRILKPDEVYNLAAQSHVRVSFDEPTYTSDVTGLGALRVLEALRQTSPESRFYQASSSEMFGSTLPPQSETSAFHPQSPYGSAKLYAHWITKNFRESHNMHASAGILFNHESPRRGESFVTKKIAMAAARISVGMQSSIRLGNLEAVRDWGYAPEYVRAMWLMLQKDSPADYVIATGQAVSVREFGEICFSRMGLKLEDHIIFDERLTRPSEVQSLVGYPEKARDEIGWRPTVKVQELAERMVDFELARLIDGGVSIDIPDFGD